MQSQKEKFEVEAKIGTLRSCIKELTVKLTMGSTTEVDRKQLFSFKRQLAKI